MNNRFVYDEKTSSLYAPDGTFLKRIYCPKAMDWNQLQVRDGEDRWRGCDQCQESVINLDQVDLDFALDRVSDRESLACVHLSFNSDRVIILRDARAVPPIDKERLSQSVPIIRTAWSIADINRAVGMGYWPDVRLVQPDTENIRGQIAIDQHLASGKIRAVTDRRRTTKRVNSVPSARHEQSEIHEHEAWREVLPFNTYYPSYRSSPIAAYLIPRELPDGAQVIAAEPIEDIVGFEWNQGVAFRADNVFGRVRDKRVVLDPRSVERMSVVG